jgi:DNA (cytosine-5)-methyltransferase 1
MNKPTVISLFAGAGGMDLGFQKAGFKIIWANDFDKDSVDTYKKNFGNHIVLGDIKDIPSSVIPNNPDVVIGGFPCQGFSINNKKRSMDDERNHLYKEMLRIIKDKKPKYFVAENVKGILSLEKGGVIKLIVNDFKKIGYDVDYKLLTASDYGVPQNRQRVFIIGNRINKINPYPKITHYNPNLKKNQQLNLINNDLKPYVTAKEVLEYLSNVRISYDPIKLGDKYIYNHIARTNVEETFWGRKYKVNQHDICDYLKEARNNSEWSTQKIDEYFGYRHTAGHWFRKDNNSGSIPSPEDWWELKKLLKFDSKFDKAVTTLVEKTITFEQSLRIANWDTPSDTITATGTEIHPNKKRRISVREAAILQTFPDDFIFEGAMGSMYKQIGNAVPVELAKLVAKKVKSQIT